MNTKALNSLADLICRAQENGKRTPMGIAMAIDSAGRHMSPETALEMYDLRTRLAAMANPPRELYLAQYDGVEPELFTTVEAAREYCDDVAPSDAHGKCWDWTVNEHGIHVQFWTHPDDDRPMSDTSGYVTPIVVQGDEPLSELERLRARVAELEAERHSTNEALADITVAERSADRLTALFAPTQVLREESLAEAVTPRVQAMRALLDGQRAAVEDPHDGPLHHSYRVPRDLPETGGSR